MLNTKRTINIVLVGSVVGKTCLLETYVNNKFSDTFSPTVFHDYEKTLSFGQTDYTLNLHDTSGVEDYDRLRPLSYRNTDIFLVCYSVVVPYTAEYVKDKWVPEIVHHCPNTPFILVGTQSDLRDREYILEALDKQNQKPISFEEGVELAKDVKAVKYVECSAINNVGVKGVFEEAIIALISPKKQEIKQTCCIS